MLLFCMQQENKKLSVLLALVTYAGASEQAPSQSTSPVETQTPSMFAKAKSVCKTGYDTVLNLTNPTGVFSANEEFTVFNQAVAVKTDVVIPVSYIGRNSVAALKSATFTLSVGMAKIGVTNENRLSELTAEMNLFNYNTNLNNAQTSVRTRRNQLGSKVVYLGASLPETSKTSNSSIVLFFNDTSTFMKHTGIAIGTSLLDSALRLKLVARNKSVALSGLLSLNNAYVTEASLYVRIVKTRAIIVTGGVQFMNLLTVLVSQTFNRGTAASWYSCGRAANTFRAAAILSYGNLSVYADTTAKISVRFTAPSLNRSSVSAASNYVTSKFNRA